MAEEENEWEREQSHRKISKYLFRGKNQGLIKELPPHPPPSPQSSSSLWGSPGGVWTYIPATTVCILFFPCQKKNHPKKQTSVHIVRYPIWAFGVDRKITGLLSQEGDELHSCSRRHCYSTPIDSRLWGCSVCVGLCVITRGRVGVYSLHLKDGAKAYIASRLMNYARQNFVCFLLISQTCL